jgi:hypothetical protein
MIEEGERDRRILKAVRENIVDTDLRHQNDRNFMSNGLNFYNCLIE